MIKALVLYSGGLDSRLVIKILEEQGMIVEAVYFSLPFGEGCCNNLSCVFNFAQKENVKLNIIDCTKGRLFKEYMEIIKNPSYGRGKALNPCKDCRIFMLKKAKELAESIGAEIIATGEVLSQRPFSQNKQHLDLIERKAGLEKRILRPLSAKLLPKTVYEENNLINRSKLLGIQGRGRKDQITLAKQYNIKYPDPGGGCLLCDKRYVEKLRSILNDISIEKIRLISNGRMFKGEGIIILGRDDNENNNLISLNNMLKYNILYPDNGPVILFENILDENLANDLMEAYSGNDLLLRKKYDCYKVIKE